MEVNKAHKVAEENNMANQNQPSEVTSRDMGGTGSNADELVMVLEDYDTALVFGAFTLIATDGV